MLPVNKTNLINGTKNTSGISRVFALLCPDVTRPIDGPTTLPGASTFSNSVRAASYNGRFANPENQQELAMDVGRHGHGHVEGEENAASNNFPLVAASPPPFWTLQPERIAG